jgi:hypothetical protein
LYPRVGFIVTNLKSPAERVVKFYNGRGTRRPADTAVAPVIEVALGGAIVRVPPEVDGRLLAKVLRAVKSVA